MDISKEIMSKEVKCQLINQKIQMWQNTYYDAQLDAKVAEALEDQRMKEQAANRMKQALKAIDILEKEMEVLE